MSDYQLDFSRLNEIAGREHHHAGDKAYALEALPHLLKWGRRLGDLVADESAKLRLAERGRDAACVLRRIYAEAAELIAGDFAAIEGALDDAGFVLGSKADRVGAALARIKELEGVPPKLAEATAALCEAASDVINWLELPELLLADSSHARRLGKAMMEAAVAIDRAHLLVAPGFMTITAAKNRITALEHGFRRLADIAERDKCSEPEGPARAALDCAYLRVESELSALGIHHERKS